MDTAEVPAASLPDASLLFSRSWKLYRERLMTVLVVGGIGAAASLLCLLIPFMGAFLAMYLLPYKYAPWVLASLVAISGVLWFASWSQVAMMEAVLDPRGDLGVAGYYRVSWPKIIPFSWVCLLWFVVASGGFFLLVLPGVFLTIALFFAPFACVAEGLGGMDSLERSLDYVAGRWWGVLGRITMAGAATTLPGMVPLAGPILGVVAAPFALANAAVLYCDLREAHKDRPFVPSRKRRLLIAAAGLGLLWPAWMSARMISRLPSMAQALENQIRTIAQHPLDPSAATRLLSVLQGGMTQESASLAFELMQASAGGGNPELGALVAQLRSGAPQSRLEAALRLERIADPSTGPPLIASLLDGDPELRPVCRRALERMGYDVSSLPGVRAKVESLLRDLESDPAARRGALEALGDLGDSRDLPAIRRKFSEAGVPADDPALLETEAKLSVRGARAP